MRLPIPFCQFETRLRKKRSYFNRDVDCIRTFFKRRFRYESQAYPRFRASVSEGGEREFRLDVEVEASGFGNKEARQLAEVRSSCQGATTREMTAIAQYMELVGAGEDDEDEGSSDEEAEGGDEQVEEDPKGDAQADTASAASTSDVDEAAGQNHDRHTTADADDTVTPALERLSTHDQRDVSATVAAEAAKRQAKQARRHHGRGKVSSGKRRGPKRGQDAASGVKDALSGW